MIVYTDGGSRSNPGKAGIGVVICDDKNRVITTHKEFIGVASNNVAEYRAIIKALEMLSHRKGERISVFSDSELVVKQLNNVYKVKHKDMKVLFEKVKDLEKIFGKVYYTHVRREHEKIVIADRLVNEVLDEN